MSRYRIILNSDRLYEIEKKSFFGWSTIKEWDGCDPLGVDYGYSEKTFNNIEDAEEYIEKIENENKRIVVKEIWKK